MNFRQKKVKIKPKKKFQPQNMQSCTVGFNVIKIERQVADRGPQCSVTWCNTMQLIKKIVAALRECNGCKKLKQLLLLAMIAATKIYLREMFVAGHFKKVVFEEVVHS